MAGNGEIVLNNANNNPPLDPPAPANGGVGDRPDNVADRQDEPRAVAQPTPLEQRFVERRAELAPVMAQIKAAKAAIKTSDADIAAQQWANKGLRCRLRTLESSAAEIRLRYHDLPRGGRGGGGRGGRGGGRGRGGRGQGGRGGWNAQ